MSKEPNRIHAGLLVLWCAASLGVVSLGCRKEPSGQSEPQPPAPVGAQTSPASQTVREPSLRLADLVAAAKSWHPTFEASAGKPVPDFTVKDIQGQEHKLSDYRGRQVLVVMWAPWCGVCKAGIPDLIELRKAQPEDQLALLALSPIAPDNTEAMVKQFVAQPAADPRGPINYTVAAVQRESLPAPLNAFEYLPTRYFIAADGTLKLAAVGTVPLAEMQAILKARFEAPRVRTPAASPGTR
ncbi:MAG: TlpA family protein disulfide reductase [Phycisphaerae bacterium]|nr:TlpA family protein disulfide reductase [Phycisphaerae bacterium]